MNADKGALVFGVLLFALLAWLIAALAAHDKEAPPPASFAQCRVIEFDGRIATIRCEFIFPNPAKKGIQS